MPLSWHTRRSSGSACVRSESASICLRWSIFAWRRFASSSSVSVTSGESSESPSLLAWATAAEETPLLSPAQHVDIAPRAGTLVVFRSDTVPHEVRHTSAKRMAIIGWLHRELGEAEAPAEPPEEELSELALALKRHYEGRGEKIKGFESVDAVSVPGE